MWRFCTCRFPSVQQKSTSARLAISMDMLPVYVIRRNKFFFSSLGNQRPTCCKWEQYMLVTSPYAATQKIWSLVMILFCLQVKIQCTQADCKKIPTPSYLTTNLAYKLMPYHTRNQYLRARLDTCTNVYIKVKVLLFYIVPLDQMDHPA